MITNLSTGHLSTDPARKVLMVSLLILLFTLPLVSQDQYRKFYSESLKINNTGMYVLGSWALLNIASGAYGYSKFAGPARYIHQMNLFWNVVNLSIAGFALYGYYTSEYQTWGQEKILEKQLSTQNLFLINAGLDVVYMGTGFVLRRLSKRYPKNSDRLMGYGNSVILQGAFLFVFDLVLYGFQSGHRNGFIEQIALVPASAYPGLSLQISF